jgi:hypothetical protein
MVLSFVRPSRPIRRLGPFATLRIDARSLCDGDNGSLIARHVLREWQVDDERFFRIECQARAVAWFADGPSAPSRRFGPFAGFSVADGLVFMDSRAFANLDGKFGEWLCYDLGRYWPTLVIAAAPREP